MGVDVSRSTAERRIGVEATLMSFSILSLPRTAGITLVSCQSDTTAPLLPPSTNPSSSSPHPPYPRSIFLSSYRHLGEIESQRGRVKKSRKKLFISEQAS